MKKEIFSKEKLLKPKLGRTQKWLLVISLVLFFSFILPKHSLLWAKTISIEGTEVFIQGTETAPLEKVIFQSQTGGIVVPKVGIGTANPLYPLDVNGGARFTQPIIVGTPDPDNPSHAATVDYVDAVVIGEEAIGTWKLEEPNLYPLQTAWNVGIGTENPSEKLEVDGFVKSKNYQVSEEGLVLGMNFNSATISGTAGSEKIRDSSGYNNHGTNHGATFNATSGFNGSGAFSFDGVDDYVDCGNDESLKITDAITIEAWVKGNATGDFYGIVSKKYDSTYALYKRDNDTWLTWRIQTSDGDMICSVGGFSCGIWQHIVATYDKDIEAMDVYINGVRVGHCSGKTGTIQTNALNLWIGSGHSGAVKHFNGLIDDVRIYNRALSADEIKSHYLQKAEIYNSFVSQKDVYVDSTGNVDIGNALAAASGYITGDLEVSTGDLIVGSSDLYVNNDTGNVGIRTTGPNAPLVVYGGEGTYTAPNFGSGNRGAIHIRNLTSDRRNAITFSPAGTDSAQAGIYVHQDNSAGTHMYFATTNSYATGPQARVTILNTGRVGIGTTSPGQKLDVSGGNIRTTGQLISTIATGTAPLTVLSTTKVANLNADYLDGHDTSYFQTALTNPVTGTGAPGYLPKFTGTSTIDKSKLIDDGAIIAVDTGDLYINTVTGHVGIGTTDPNQKLAVAGTLGILEGDLSPTYYTIFQGGDQSANITYILPKSAGSAGQVLTTKAGGELFWEDVSSSLPSGSSGQTLRHDGNNWIANNFLFNNGTSVGIGDTTPTEGTLTVAGTGFFTGALTSATVDTDVVNANSVYAGKINADEIDPTYRINDVAYATYGHSTTGLKEETTGKLRLQALNSKRQIPNKFKNQNSNDQIYIAILDFDKQEVGSDLWLFRQITAFGENWQDLVVSLTPEGRAEVWYELDEKENTLTIFGTKPVAVSYRLIAPRFDWPERDTNIAKDQNIPGIPVDKVRNN